MNRKHSVEDYLKIVEKIRNVRPDIALSSDFIVGFPEETDKDFEDTMKFIEKVNFVIAYSFIYSPRPGTPAQNKDNISILDKKARLSALQSLLTQQQINFNKSFAEDALTIKQQLDRIMEEVKDLNKAVFNKSFDTENLNSLNESIDAERFTSIDIRIYDLEKDIKNLTLQFEEILFKLDDISNDMVGLESKLISKLEQINIEPEKNIENNEAKSEEDLEVEEENTLGKIVISDNNNNKDNKDSSVLNVEEEKNSLLQEVSNLNPEEQIQYALDQMMKKNYNEAKNIFDQFIENFPENQLSGSAHFWLGKIYLFETNYRKAAIIFGEGVQKFPKSIKAPEMYYELAKSLKEMHKIPESCKTLTLLEQNYSGNKFIKDPEKIKDKLNCD